MYSFLYVLEWVITALSISMVVAGAVILIRPVASEYRDRKTLLAIVALCLLALIALCLAIAQVLTLIRGGLHTYFLFMAIFFLMTAILQSGVFHRSLKGRLWRIYRVVIMTFAVAFAIFAVVIYMYNL